MVLRYLDIVNKAMAEAKVTVDPLTAANFAAPPRTLLYNMFKEWVNVAYEELLIDRPDWYFRKERTTVSVWPRLLLGEVAGSIAVGDILVGDTSGVQFRVVATHSHEEAEQNLETELTVSAEFTDQHRPSNFIYHETLNRLSPTPVTDIAYLSGVGRYDFKSLVPGLQSIDEQSVNAHKTPEDNVNGTYQSGTFPVTDVTWPVWNKHYDLFPWTEGGFPQYISQTSQGNYALYPQPLEETLLSFEYTRKVLPLVLWNDVPEGLPEKYHRYLVWRAVQEFADFDKNGALFMRATKHVDKYLFWLMRDESPSIGFAPSRFDF